MTQAVVRQTERQLHALYTALIFSRPGSNSEYSQADQDYWVVKNYADPQKLEFAIAPIERELKVTVEQEADDWLDRRIKIDHPGLRRRMKRYQEVHAERWEEALAVGAEQLAKRREKAIAKLQDLKQQVEANSANLMRWVEELEKMVAELRSLGQPATYEDRYLDAIQTIKARIETYQNLYLPKIAELLCPEGNVTTAIATTQPKDEPEIREAISTGEVALQARLRELCEERAQLRKTEGRLLQNNRQDLLNETGDQVVALNAEIAAIRQQLYPENFIAEEVPEPEEPPFKPGDWVEAEPMGYAHGKTALFLIRGTVVEPHPGIDDELSGGIPIEYMLYEPDYPDGIKARTTAPVERIKKLDELAPLCDITKYLPPQAEPDAVKESEAIEISDRPQEDLPVSTTEELDESLAGKPVRFELYTTIWTGTATGCQTKTHVEVQYSPGQNKPNAKIKIPRTDLIEIDGQYVEHPEYQEGDRVRIVDAVVHPKDLIGHVATVIRVFRKVVRLKVQDGKEWTFYQHEVEPIEQAEVEEDAPGDIAAALLAALRQQGGLNRWDVLKAQGATDNEIQQVLSRIFGEGCGSSEPHWWSAKGGGNPKFWNQIASTGKPDLQGKQLVQRVRELLEIPQLKSPTAETFEALDAEYAEALEQTPPGINLSRQIQDDPFGEAVSVEAPTQAKSKKVRHISLSKHTPRLCEVLEGVYYLASHLTPWQAEEMTSLCPECLSVWRSQSSQPSSANNSTIEEQSDPTVTPEVRSPEISQPDPIVKVWRQFEGAWYYAGQMGYQSKVTLRPGDITCLPDIDPNLEPSALPAEISNIELPPVQVEEILSEPPKAIAPSPRSSSGKNKITDGDSVPISQLSLF